MATNTKYFKVSEFQCKCGCEYNVIDQRVINMAQVVREALGIPVHVNSECRCETHNKAFGGLDGSLALLITLAVIDYLSGLCVGWLNHNLSAFKRYSRQTQPSYYKELE